MWTLVIVLLANTEPNALHVEQVQGFTSVELCNRASRAWEKIESDAYRTVATLCMEM